MAQRKHGSRLVGTALISLLAATGCKESGAGKAWSELSVCAFGKAANLAPGERMQQLRLLQLSNPGTDGKADAWPGRCGTYANQLYAALESSGNQALLKRGLQNKLGCVEGKPSCVLNGETLSSLNGELTEAAKAAELKLEAAPSVKEPEVTVKVSLSATDWRPLQKQPAQMVGPDITAEGKVRWLLKSTTDRTRPTGCVYAPSSKQIECTAGHEKMPALPPQSVQLVNDDKDIIVAGLTEKGPAAFNLASGEPVVAKGLAGNLLRDGLAIERGENDKGFVAIALTKGKAAKPIELKSKGEITQPLSLGSQIVWLEPGQGSATLVVKGVKGTKLVDAAALSGTFSGPFHWCRSSNATAVATWGLHAGQRGAKPSVGSDKTQVTVALFSDKAWSKPLEAQVPFRRAIESELICNGATATMAWAEPVEGGVKVGQLTCNKDACKTQEALLTNVDSRWWWSVGPVGDKVLVMWRASLGEARMRLGPIAQLDQARDVVLFDDQEHGGPKAGEATSVFTSDGALLFFKQEPPVVLNITSDGQARVLTAK